MINTQGTDIPTVGINIPTGGSVAVVEDAGVGAVGGKKEVALKKAGATREAAYKVMVEALGAETLVVDKFGDEHRAEDHGARLKAAEMISKLNGDMKEVVVDNRTYNTLIQATPEEIKVFMEMVEDVRGQLERLESSGHQTGEVRNNNNSGEAIDAELI